MSICVLATAQTKIKESEVPKAVLLALENTYKSYKVKSWFQNPGQYIAELVVDGQAGKVRESILNCKTTANTILQTYQLDTNVGTMSALNGYFFNSKVRLYAASTALMAPVGPEIW